MSIVGSNNVLDLVNQTDIVYWYRASDLTTLNQGDIVSTWSDRGLSGYTLTQTNPIKQPRVNIDSEGYKSVVFDSTFLPLSVSAKTMTCSGVKQFDNMTFFVVYRPILLTGSTRCYFKKTGQPRPQFFIQNNIMGQEVINSEALYIADVFNKKYCSSLQFNLTSGGNNRYIDYNGIYKTTKSAPTSTGTYGNGVSTETITIGESPSASFEIFEILNVRNTYDTNTTKKIMRALSFGNGLLI